MKFRIYQCTFSFHLDGFEGEFFARDDLDVDPIALRAGKFLVGRMVRFGAGHTLQLSGQAAEVQFCLLGDRPFGDDLPVELDRVIHHAGQIADDNVQIRNTFGVRLLSVFQRDL
jgi:hypothetical protein